MVLGDGVGNPGCSRKDALAVVNALAAVDVDPCVPGIRSNVSSDGEPFDTLDLLYVTH